MTDSGHLEILHVDHLISTGPVVTKTGHVGADSGSVVNIGPLVNDSGSVVKHNDPLVSDPCHPGVHVVQVETTGLSVIGHLVD